MTGNYAFASRGANIAFSKGIVVVASAGNSGNTGNPHVGVPAEATNVLAIGAVQFDESYATFSSIGPSFDNRIKPDLMAQGQSVTLANSNGSIVQASGTSFSGPIIAGMIASFWQAVPTLTNQQVVNYLRQSADRFLNPNAQYGYGIPDFQLALNNALLSIEPSQIKDIIVYPNPSNDFLKVHFTNENDRIDIKVYNNLGQLVLENTNLKSDENLNLQNLSSGIYTYKITSSNATRTGKIIKK